MSSPAYRVILALHGGVAMCALTAPSAVWAQDAVLQPKAQLGDIVVTEIGRASCRERVLMPV